MNITKSSICRLIAAIQAALIFFAAAASGKDESGAVLRDEAALDNFNKLFPNECKKTSFDPELCDIANKFIYGDVFESGVLSYKQRELITIIALVVNQCHAQIEEHVLAALNVGASALEIREAVYTLSPLSGFPKVINAMEAVNTAFQKRGIKLPLKESKTVCGGERFKKGREIQAPIYGDRTKNIVRGLPENSDCIPKFLTEVFFGDFYTRDGIDIKTRELLVFCALVSMGGIDYSIGSHAMGNLKVGNSKETLVAGLIQCVPYIGFPRVLNALKIIKSLNSNDM